LNGASSVPAVPIGVGRNKPLHNHRTQNHLRLRLILRLPPRKRRKSPTPQRGGGFASASAPGIESIGSDHWQVTVGSL
jgi:hypothetical protein